VVGNLGEQILFGAVLCFDLAHNNTNISNEEEDASKYLFSEDI
jgi:hypothetical protein